MTATALVVPTTRDAMLALTPRDVYMLEQAGQVAREIVDNWIVEWTEGGWSQAEIAQELGCSQQAVSKRQSRIGIEPSQPNRPHKVQPSCTSPTDTEIVEGEIMEPESQAIDGADLTPIPIAAESDSGSSPAITASPMAESYTLNSFRELITKTFTPSNIQALSPKAKARFIDLLKEAIDLLGEEL